MANVAHSTLTGAELHEPKGVDTANDGEVYIANGAGSGVWSALTTVAPTGMIADFALPIPPSGWLECDGSDVSITTYAALYSAATIQQTGTRTSGTAVITSLSSTTNMKVGYYVFGTGFASGTTILSVDSATQITVSNNASSSGSATVVISPWLLNTGTIRLPSTTGDSGRFRRSRSSTTAVGQLQANQNKAHTHDVSGTTSSAGGHTPTGSISDSGVHSHVVTYNTTSAALTGGASPVVTSVGAGGSGSGTVNNNAGHTITMNAVANHDHTFSDTSTSDGGTDARPNNIVVLTCIKT